MTRTLYMIKTHTRHSPDGRYFCAEGDRRFVYEPFTEEQEKAWADLSYRNSDEGWEGETPELEYVYEQAFGKRTYVTYTLA